MSATMEKLFNLPDLGEGLTESEILVWRVAEGEHVELNQVIAEVETAKAIVEIPSPFSGVVKKLYEPVGAVVNVGSPLVSFDVQDDPGAGTGTGTGARDTRGGGEATATRQPTLVGYGAAVESDGHPVRRERKAQTPRDLPAEPATVSSGRGPAVTPDPKPTVANPGLRLVGTGEAATRGIGHLRATPPVRKLARDHHIDLASVQGTGTNGLITREDVLRASGDPGAGTPGRGAAGADAALPPESGDAWAERRTPIRGVRKTTAAAMVASAFSAPHVTEFLSVDVTETVALLERLRTSPRFADVKITLTTLVAKVVALALARHRTLNSHWDGERGEIVEFGHVNLGIAAATDRGLMVPVVHGAQGMDLARLAREIGELTGAARAGSITPAQLSGGTFSISNVGVFGVDGGTPILPPGQSGILAMGQVRKMPWEHRDEIRLRQVMVLSLSFDHRVVDGEQGARFLAEIGQVMGDPSMLIGLV